MKNLRSDARRSLYNWESWTKTKTHK
jgi:hypothetical protein